MSKSLCNSCQAVFWAIVAAALLVIGSAGCSTKSEVSVLDDLRAAETLIKEAELNTNTDAAQRQFIEARKLLTATIGVNGLAPRELSTAYGLRGRVYQTIGALDRAQADLDESIRLNPDNLASRFNRAVIFGLIGNLERGIADLTRIIESGEAVPGAYGLRGSMFYQQGRFEEAEADLTNLIDHDPLSATYIELRGDTLRELSEFDAAIRDYKNVIKLTNELLDSLGFVDRGVGENYEEERILEKIAATLIDANRYEEAIQTYEQILEINPSNDEATQRIEDLSRTR